ncbi:MAG: TrkA family potassium uptake protein [Ruminococcaceae bacterium]|nr:TrkA family potassium uptake protein [Oscillospiraceae bacterium]
MKNILLIGMGRFGKTMAAELDKLGHQVMAVDSREKCINECIDFVTSAQIGDTTNPEFLKGLGIDNYDVCIVTIKKDFQSSLETTTLLKDLGAKLVVSRAASDFHARFLLRNGADKVIFPEKQMAKWAAVRYGSNNMLDYVELDENISIFELDVPHSWVGKTVAQIDVRKKYNINILGMFTNGKLSVTMGPDTVFTAEHPILVLGNYKDVQKCFKL